MSCFQGTSKSHKSLDIKYRHIRKSLVTSYNVNYNVNKMSAKLNFFTESVCLIFNLLQTQPYYISPITLLCRVVFIWWHKYQSSSFSQPKKKTKSCKAQWRCKERNRKKKKDFNYTTQSRAPVLAFINSLEQASAYFQHPDEENGWGKRNRWLTVQIGKHNKKFKMPHFLVQGFDYPVSFLEGLISVYFCVYVCIVHFPGIFIINTEQHWNVFQKVQFTELFLQLNPWSSAEHLYSVSLLFRRDHRN